MKKYLFKILNNKQIKNWIIPALVLVTVLCFISRTAHASGVIYETKTIGDNKIRITLKWSDPKEAKGIAISCFSLQNGKTLSIGFEVSDKGPKTAYLDYDTTNALNPIRIILKKVGDLDWRPLFDIKGIEAEEYIWHLHDAGIVGGDGKGRFVPNRNITRAEFATILAKALKLDGKAENTEGFKDIDKSSAKKYILLVVKKGLMSGYKDKTFKPDNPMTVAEVCTSISKAFNFKTVRNGIYTKLKPDKSYSAAVKKIFEAGILSVDDSIYKNFNEESKISRANCAIMISRALTTY